MYLHVTEYIKPFIIDKRKAPRDDRPISTHQNSSIKLQFIQEKVRNSLKKRDPIQSDDEQMSSSHLYLYTN